MTTRRAGRARALRDICISGNGEPTLSAHLARPSSSRPACDRASSGLLGSASLVVHHQLHASSDPAVSALLERMSKEESLAVWAKLDAGGEQLFDLMSGTQRGFERALGCIRSFSKKAPVVIQTMLCEVDGRRPADSDIDDYARSLSLLAGDGAQIAEVHLYTYARPSPGGRCAALGDGRMVECARRVRGPRASASGPSAPTFGAAKLIDLHSHSTASDGSYAPAELVALALERGLSALALTDHDTVSGLPEAEAAAAGTALRIIRGVEIEIAFEPGEFHLLGLRLENMGSELVETLAGSPARAMRETG